MDVETAELLTTDLGRDAVLAAQAEKDPSSLAAATRLRATFPAAVAAAALTQAQLRSKAGKLGPHAQDMLLTPVGLEQATRWDVAWWRAGVLAAAGVDTVVDLGCGLGTDAMAFSAAGMRVVAVERDPVTAVLARANLGTRAEVVEGDAEDYVAGLTPHDAQVVFCDPARRSARGRSWKVSDLSPSWDFVTGLVAGPHRAVVKLGPGLSRSLIPASASATWTGVGPDLVECALWSGVGFPAGARRAVLLPAGDQLVDDGTPVPAALQRPVLPGDVVYEPHAAVIRAGAVGTLARFVDAVPIREQVAYLVADDVRLTPFAEAFRVREVLPWKESVLRSWTADNSIGIVEIKKRGIDTDPAILRRRLRLRGKGSATLIISPSVHGAVCLVADRLG